MRRFKCLSVDTTNMRHFTIGKIYETDNNMLNYRLDGGNMADYCPLIEDGDVERGLVFEEIKEEGENKMEDLRELIKVCYVIKMRDEKYAFVGQATGGICFDWKDGASCMMLYDYNKNLCYCDDYPRYDVMEIYGYSKHPYASTNASIEGRPLIWKRTELSPTQLKLEELEKKQREIADEMEKLRKEL